MAKTPPAPAEQKLIASFPFTFEKVTRLNMDKVICTVDTIGPDRYRLIYSSAYLVEWLKATDY